VPQGPRKKRRALKKKGVQVALEERPFLNAHPFLYFFFDATFFRFCGVTALLGPRDLGFIDLVPSVCFRALDFFLDAPIGPFDLVPPLSLSPLFLADLDDLWASLETRDLDTGFFLSALNADDPNPSSESHSDSDSDSDSGSSLHLPRLLGRDSSGLKLGRALGGLPGCFLVDRGLVSTL
jgi:hypothetical protein